MSYIRLLILIAATTLSAPAVAQFDATVVRADTTVVHAEIRHLRELMQANDLRYQAQLDAQKEAVSTALAAAKEATNKADVATEKRLEGVNEFRDQLRDQAATFVTRNELWGYVLGIFGVIVALLNYRRRSNEEKQ